MKKKKIITTGNKTAKPMVRTVDKEQKQPLKAVAAPTPTAKPAREKKAMPSVKIPAVKAAEPRLARDRYERIGERLLTMRLALKDTLAAHLKGEDVGFPLFPSEYKNPVPKRIMGSVGLQLEQAIKDVNCAISELVRHWCLDYPKAEIPKEITSVIPGL